METALGEENGLELSQLEYITHLVIPHMDDKLVTTKFSKDLESGIMNQSAPKYRTPRLKLQMGTHKYVMGSELLVRCRAR